MVITMFQKSIHISRTRGKIKLKSQLSLRQGHEAIYDVQYNLNINIKIVILKSNAKLILIM